jgi:hypothetical protein
MLFMYYTVPEGLLECDVGCADERTGPLGMSVPDAKTLPVDGRLCRVILAIMHPRRAVRMPAPRLPPETVPYTLEELWDEVLCDFREHGYIRRPVRGRSRRNSSDDEWEVRFVLDGKAQLPALLARLRAAGYSAGEPFRKHGKWQVSLTGRDAVELIEELWGHSDRALSP